MEIPKPPLEVKPEDPVRTSPHSAATSPRGVTPQCDDLTARKHAWIIVSLLAFMYAASLIDRMIPALLADAIRADLGITTVQFGLLVGTAFGLLYAAIGIPAAQLIDQGNRKWIMTVGISLWTISTIGSAFAENFTHLVIARAGLAIGEAVLAPAAISMIGDLFDNRDRTRATSLYAVTGQVMGSGLFLAGAGAVTLATMLSVGTTLTPWRMTFVIVGLPPLILTILWICIVREPERRVLGVMEIGGGIRAGLRYLREKWQLYIPMFTAIGLMDAIAFAALSWLPTILIWQHGMTAVEAGMAMGLVGIPPSLIGAALAPTVAMTLGRRGLKASHLWVAITLSILAAVALAATLASESKILVLSGFAIGVFGIAGMNVMPLIVIQTVAPTRTRGRLAAMNQLTINVLGLAGGPPLVALIAREFLGDDDRIAQAFFFLATGGGIAAVLLFLLSVPALTRAQANI